MMWLGILLVALVGVVVYDLTQKKHAILHNFPLIGHLRYLFEKVGPELRQYIVTNNDEERPFSRDQRRWIYTSAKKTNNYFGFGTDNDLDAAQNYVLFHQAAFPLLEKHAGEDGYDPDHALPCTKVMGAAHGRKKAFRPASVVNVSAMSFGSLGAAAVTALNQGVAAAEALHNTGEGGVSPYHLKGGDLIWQIGTGYFGARAADGGFSMEAFSETCQKHPKIRAVEIKLSQGAKPGVGGFLPGAKVTAEIAAIRGIPVGRDCISPSRHLAFEGVDGLIDFIEQLAEASGLPVGIKSAVGEESFWRALAERMKARDAGPDFISIDGGEGGTGAGPLVFTDHVSLPFRFAFSRIFRVFVDAGIDRDIVFIGAGRLGLPDSAFLAFGLGCDMINVAREAMMAIGCIQAQRCESGHCPTGVATQNAWLQRGLDPASKSVRLQNYIQTLRKELLRLARACGEEHPAQVSLTQMEILDAATGPRPASEVFGYADLHQQAAKADPLEV
ncbi:MAG: glutamate synthase-related protein [Planctomycetota bacterium]|jgi:glutamate synthase domain-containing protein 2